MKFSKISETVEPSAILEIAARVRERVRAGKVMLNFTIGDFDPKIFRIPAALKEAIMAAYRDHLTNYPQAEGNLDLREAILEYNFNFFGLEYGIDEVIVASGGRPLIFTLYFSLCDPGERIIYPVPSWNNNYYSHLVSADAKVITTTFENGFLLTAEEIQPHIGSARLLALCSPQNPTGTVYTKEQLQAICDLVIEENERRGEGRKLYVLFDQLYAQLTFGAAEFYNPVMLDPRMKDYTILVDAVSKSFAATGLRVGWCLGPSPLIARMKVLLAHIGAWAPMPEQKGLAKFLKDADPVRKFIIDFRRAIEERLTHLYLGFMQLKAAGYAVDAIQPQGAIFLSVWIDAKEGAAALMRFLLDECNIAMVPFSAFGAAGSEGWCRLSVGTSTTADISSMLMKLQHGLLRQVTGKVKNTTYDT